MHRRWFACLAIAASAALVACGDDDDGDDSGQAATGGGELFSQTTDAGTLQPVEGEDGVFTLTLENPAPQVTTFSDRPVRNAGTEGLARFVDQWDARGFADDPPNAALVLDSEPDDADTAVFTLAEPSYDQQTGAVTYRAERIEGGGTESLPKDETDLPAQFRDAHLFIDPAATAAAHDVFMKFGSKPGGGRVEVKFDSGFSIVLGPGGEDIAFVGGGPGGGSELAPQFLTFAGTGTLEFNVTGPVPITGTAQVPSGITVTAQVDDGPTQPIANGRFCLGTGCAAGQAPGATGTTATTGGGAAASSGAAADDGTDTTGNTSTGG